MSLVIFPLVLTRLPLKTWRRLPVFLAFLRLRTVFFFLVTRFLERRLEVRLREVRRRRRAAILVGIWRTCGK